MSIASITITGPDPGDFAQTNNCGSSVGAATSCSISVTFTPITIGTRTANISIADSSTDSPQQVSLAGVGYTKGKAAAVHSGLTGSGQIAIPAPTGRNVVGTEVIYLTDPTRNDPYVSSGAKRELAVRLWYPTMPRRECQTAEYTSPAVWKYFAHLVNVEPFHVATNSCLNALSVTGSIRW